MSILVDDSSEGYIAGNDTYYLTIQLLEGEGLKKEEFEFNELPYPTLARFGLTQEMIEDLPLCILKEIGKGGYSPVLPMLTAV